MTLASREIESIREEFPKFRMLKKRGDPLSHVIDWALRLVTLGQQRAYISQYHTVLGYRLYLPDQWGATSDAQQAIVLRHERVHLRQRKRHGLALMALLYFLPWFPIGLAYGRARLEWEAYTETLRATAELLGFPAACCPQLREQIIQRFVGPAYAWMWPFRTQVERWYDEALNELAAHHKQATRPHP